MYWLKSTRIPLLLYARGHRISLITICPSEPRHFVLTSLSDNTWVWCIPDGFTRAYGNGKWVVNSRRPACLLRRLGGWGRRDYFWHDIFPCILDRTIRLATTRAESLVLSVTDTVFRPPSYASPYPPGKPQNGDNLIRWGPGFTLQEGIYRLNCSLPSMGLWLSHSPLDPAGSLPAGTWLSSAAQFRSGAWPSFANTIMCVRMPPQRKSSDILVILIYFCW